MFRQTADIYDALYSFRDFAGQAARLRELIETRTLRPAATLLDVGCATGSHAAALASWYPVVEAARAYA